MEDGKEVRVTHAECTNVRLGDPDGKWGGEVIINLETGEKIVFTCNDTEKNRALYNAFIHARPHQAYVMPKKS